MKTLEQLRKEAEEKYAGHSDPREVFRAGWEAAVRELTKWHDPKEELPDTCEDVLIKTTSCIKYSIAFFKDGSTNYRWHENNGSIDDDMVIGWRPIIENNIL